MMIATDTMADLPGRMDALLRQEATYRAEDYLSQCCSRASCPESGASDTTDPPSRPSTIEDEVVSQSRSAPQYRKRRSHEISPPCSPSASAPPLTAQLPSSAVPCETAERTSSHAVAIPPSPSQAAAVPAVRSSSPSSVEDSSDLLPSSSRADAGQFDRRRTGSGTRPVGATPEAALNQDWRAQMTEWQFKVSDSLSMSREIVAVSSSYLDRYLSSTGPYISRRHFQLVSMTCLYLATKLYDHKILPPGSIVNLSRGHFTAADIERMERKVLTELGWKVSPPTPLTFARHLLLFLPPDAVTKSVHRFIVDTTKYLTELSVIDYYFVPRRASSVGLAAVLTAMEQTYDFELDPTSRLAFERAVYAATGMDCQGPEVMECRRQLRSIYRRGVHRMRRAEKKDCRTSWTTTTGSNSSEKKKKKTNKRSRHQVEIDFQSPRSVVVAPTKA